MRESNSSMRTNVSFLILKALIFPISLYNTFGEYERKLQLIWVFDGKSLFHVKEFGGNIQIDLNSMPFI